jgi:hypothetical protein
MNDREFLVAWLIDHHTKAPPGYSFWDLVDDGFLRLAYNEHRVAYYRLTPLGERFIKGD